MAIWTAFPHDAANYSYDTVSLKKHWVRLRAGDAEPLPADAKVLAAWIEDERPRLRGPMEQ